jgi:uncharacterized protein DUF1579
MKVFYRMAVLTAAAFGISFGAIAQQQSAKTAAADAALVQAMDAAMDPGEGQKKLGFLVGTYDVKVLTWIDPSKPPIESSAVSLARWVLGDRYVQQMLSGFVMGEAWNGIGYVGYDNVAKKYVATYIDNGSTGMEWYTGTMDPDGKAAKLSATVIDPITLKSTAVQMRLHIAANGEHVTELWYADPTGKLNKVMELHYTRRQA